MSDRDKKLFTIKSGLGYIWPQSRHCLGWHFEVILFCTLLLVQQSATLSIPLATTSPKPSSLAIISSLPVNNRTPASFAFLPAPVAERETTVLTPGQMVINAVPEKDRGSFLTYQLAEALRGTFGMGNRQAQWTHTLDVLIENFEVQSPDLKDVPIYGNFATDLLQWVMEKFHLSPEDVYNQLRSRSKLLCTADGVCYNSNDLVCFCCPF